MTSASSDIIFTKVKNCLFSTAQYWGKDAFQESIKALRPVLDCIECSFWLINHNSTQKEQEEDFVSASLICREMAVSYDFQSHTDFVHVLKDGLFRQIINAKITNNSVFSFSKEDVLRFGHRSKSYVEEVGLNRFVILPIFGAESDKVIAILEMSYQKCDLDNSFWEALSMVVRPHFFETLNRYRDVQKKTLMDLLIKCHREFINVNVDILFRNIITNVLLKVCPVQSVSFYIWDIYYNRYNLVANMGLESDDTDLLDVYYQKGEGRIGYIGQTAKPLIIIGNIIKKDIENQNTIKHFEKINNKAKTEMFIPIINPAREGDVIGICRLVNKKNACNERIMDYFNDSDVSLFMCAAEYLAFIIYNYQKEGMYFSYIGRLAHDINTPIVSIRNTAYRLYDHLSDKEFIENRLEPYLKSIIDLVESQKQQVSYIHYLINSRRLPFEMRYRIEPILLYEVISSSIDIAIPFAKKHHVDLKIDLKFDTSLSLKTDKRAIITVFVNLLKIILRFNYKKQISIGITHALWEHEEFFGIDLLVYGIQGFGMQIESEFEDLCRKDVDIYEGSLLYDVEHVVVMQILKDFGCKVLLVSPEAPTIIRIKIPKHLIVDHEEF